MMMLIYNIAGNCDVADIYDDDETYNDADIYDVCGYI